MARFVNLVAFTALSTVVFLLLNLEPPGDAVVFARQATPPTLPQASVVTTYAQPANVVVLTASSDLQSAINAAPLGTTIVLEAGALYRPITLPAKSGTGWIYIISSQLGTLPQGQRVGPANVSALAKISTSSTGPAIQTAPGAHNYRFAGIEAYTTYSSTVETTYSVVSLDGGSNLPHDIIFDRSYIHGNTSGNSRRGILANGASIAVVDSDIREIHDTTNDSQGIIAWTSPGPLLIRNNYISAAGENFQTGGADPSVANMTPSDLTITGNYLFKPLSWRSASWISKNLLEIKHGQRILIEGNRMENSWAGQQNAAAWLLTVRNQDGGCNWCVVQDVTIRRNWTTHTGEGFRISGTDDAHPSQRTQRISITDNVFEDITDALYQGGGGGLAMVLTGTSANGGTTVGATNVSIDHNTILPTTQLAVTDTGGAQHVLPGFVFKNNIVSVMGYGFGGGGTQDGNDTLNGLYTSPVFTKNALVGADGSHYTGNYAANFTPSSVSTVQFTNAASHNYLLLGTSPYHLAGTDGRDLGPDYPALLAALTCTVTGACSGVTPPPPPPPPDPTPDTTAPTVSFTAPGSGATFAVGVPVTITVTDSDNVGVVSRTLTANGTSITSPRTFGVAGAVTLLATATDAAGNVGTATRNITITTAPSPVNCVVEWRITWTSGTSARVNRIVVTPASGGGTACPTTATLVIR